MSTKPKNRFEDLEPAELRRLIEEKERELEELKAALASSEEGRRKHVSHRVSHDFEMMAKGKEQSTD